MAYVLCYAKIDMTHVEYYVIVWILGGLKRPFCESAIVGVEWLVCVCMRVYVYMYVYFPFCESAIVGVE